MVGLRPLMTILIAASLLRRQTVTLVGWNFVRSEEQHLCPQSIASLSCSVALVVPSLDVAPEIARCLWFQDIINRIPQV